ncbi:hypothetical protein HK100_008133, partial [Physocladia obscura]
ATGQMDPSKKFLTNWIKSGQMTFVAAVVSPSFPSLHELESFATAPSLQSKQLDRVGNSFHFTTTTSLPHLSISQNCTSLYYQRGPAYLGLTAFAILQHLAVQ